SASARTLPARSPHRPSTQRWRSKQERRVPTSISLGFPTLQLLQPLIGPTNLILLFLELRLEILALTFHVAQRRPLELPEGDLEIMNAPLTPRHLGFELALL